MSVKPCPRCEKTFPADASFCPWCGAQVAERGTRTIGSGEIKKGDATRIRHATTTALVPRHDSLRWLAAGVGLAVIAGFAAALAWRLLIGTPPAPGVSGRAEDASPMPDIDEGEQQLTPAAARLESGGDAVRALQDLALEQVREGTVQQAATWLEAAAAAGRDRPAAERATLLADAAAARLQAGDEEAASEILDEALRLDPSSVLALGHRGTLRLRQGRPAAALADLEAALSAEPSHVEARAAQAHALLALGRVSEAVAVAEAACILAPTSAVALHAAGCAALAAGDAERAIEMARRAEAFAPGRPEIAELLARASRH